MYTYIYNYMLFSAVEVLSNLWRRRAWARPAGVATAANDNDSDDNNDNNNSDNDNERNNDDNENSNY